MGPGDEVIVPSWTFTSTAEVVRYMGADPVIIDVDPVTLNMDLAAAAAAVTQRTKALMPVHFAGLAVNQTGVADLAQQHALRVVEDAAHSFATVSTGALVGTGSSEAIVFSFFANEDDDDRRGRDGGHPKPRPREPDTHDAPARDQPQHV